MFVVLCSTLGSFLPAAKFGQVAYSAANAYLDAAASALAARQPWHVVTINWDDWVGAGMTEAARRRAGLPPLSPDHGLQADEGPDRNNLIDSSRHVAGSNPTAVFP